MHRKNLLALMCKESEGRPVKQLFQKQYDELNRELGLDPRLLYFIHCLVPTGFEVALKDTDSYTTYRVHKKNKPVAQEKHSYSWYKVWKKLLPWVLTKRSKPHPLSHPPGCATVGILGLFSGILQCGLMAQDQASDLCSNSPSGQIKKGQVYHTLMVFLNPKGHLKTLGTFISKGDLYSWPHEISLFHQHL